MNSVIWKYPLIDMADNFKRILSVPNGARLLDIQFQGRGLQSWWLVDPSVKDRINKFEFTVVGTGWAPNPDLASANYEKTVQIDGLVFHVFSRPL